VFYTLVCGLWLLYVLTTLTLYFAQFLPTCLLSFLQYTAIIFPHHVDWLIFAIESHCFYCGVGVQLAYIMSINVAFEFSKIVNYDFSYNTHIERVQWRAGLNDIHLDIFSF
jgi:hypothetical protein